MFGNLNSTFLETAKALCDEKLANNAVVLVASNDQMDKVHQVMGLVFKTYSDHDSAWLQENLPLIFINCEHVSPKDLSGFLYQTYGEIKGYMTFGLTEDHDKALSEAFRNG